MACCIIAALVLALSGRLPGRRRPDLDGGFAPVAVWPAAGTSAVATSLTAAGAHELLSRRQAALGWFLRFAACATFLYLIVSGSVAVGDIAAGAPAGAWLVRTAVLVVVGAGAALYGSKTLARGHDTSTRSHIVGYGLAATGIVALELMMLDMHILSLYHLPHGNAHNAFQALCLVCTITGGLLAGDLRLRQPVISEIRGRT